MAPEPEATDVPERALAFGLTSEEAARLLAERGKNVLPPGAGTSVPRLFAAQFIHFFAVMLWAAAALAAVAGMPQLAIAIVIVVVVNGLFAFAQEYRSDRAVAALRDLLPVRVTAVRDGRRITIDAEDLVVGDTVIVAAGDRICADLRVDRSDAFTVDESALTGESAAVHLGDGNPAYAGTRCVEGNARATVLATAGNTRLASVTTLTASAVPPPSPLQTQLRKVVRVIAIVAVAVGSAAFGASLLLGVPTQDGFLFAIGVCVALVPEGLLPTVTLSLARTAQRMARQQAFVRHLESIETLGATTFICTDKTGTLTKNEMTVISAWTPVGTVLAHGEGYSPEGAIEGEDLAIARARILGRAAACCTTGRPALIDGQWRPQGDPMEVALATFALRCGSAPKDLDRIEHQVLRRRAFDPRRRRSSVEMDREIIVMGAPDAIAELCVEPGDAAEVAHGLSHAGLRVIAFARRPRPEDSADHDLVDLETGLEMVGLAALEDPPRDTAAEAVADCRQAGIRIAMITGDHPGTAAAIGREVGLVLPDSPITVGADLPGDERELADLMDHDGIVIARATPEDKLRITKALQSRGHVVAMTGDGVNDGPALEEADVGVAMGASGTDVAREAADLILLDDRFETIAAAIELGRAGFTNIRRFLTYHLTDNVAELTPFLVWSLSAGNIPLAIGVLQILALDIGTDLLPAIALGAEPPGPETMSRKAPKPRLIDSRILVRVFGVLGPAEAAASMLAFLVVLFLGGWTWGEAPSPGLVAAASGTAFASIVLGQLANALACRSTTLWFGAVLRRRNALMPAAIGSGIVALAAFLLIPPLSTALGGSFPPPAGWALALLAIPAVLGADTFQKALRRARRGARGLP